MLSSLYSIISKVFSNLLLIPLLNCIDSAISFVSASLLSIFSKLELKESIAEDFLKVDLS